MGYKILFTEDALADLEIILDYIRADNPEVANRFGAALLNHVELLQTFPRIGVKVPRRTDIRKLLHTPIRVYYRIREDPGLIEILHFWHVSRKQPLMRNGVENAAIGNALFWCDQADLISVQSLSRKRCAAAGSGSSHSPRRSVSGGGYSVALFRTDSGTARFAVAVRVAFHNIGSDSGPQQVIDELVRQPLPARFAKRVVRVMSAYRANPSAG